MTTMVFGISDGLSPHTPLLRLHPRIRGTRTSSSTLSIVRARSCLGRPTRRHPRPRGRRSPCPSRSSGPVLVPILVCALFSLALLLFCDLGLVFRLRIIGNGCSAATGSAIGYSTRHDSVCVFVGCLVVFYPRGSKTQMHTKVGGCF